MRVLHGATREREGLLRRGGHVQRVFAWPQLRVLGIILYKRSRIDEQEPLVSQSKLPRRADSALCRAAESDGAAKQANRAMSSLHAQCALAKVREWIAVGAAHCETQYFSPCELKVPRKTLATP